MQEFARYRIGEHVLSLSIPYEMNEKMEWVIRVLKGGAVVHQEPFDMKELPLVGVSEPEAKRLTKKILEILDTLGIEGDLVPEKPDMKDRELTEEEFRTLPLSKPGSVFMVAMVDRPGFARFIQEVEFTYYHPAHPGENAKLEIIATKFPAGSSTPWFIVGIPKEDFEKVRKMGEKYGFEFKQGALPVVLSSSPGSVASVNDAKGRPFPDMKDTKAEFFPLVSTDNVYTIEGFLDEKKPEQAKKLRELEANSDSLAAAHRQNLGDE